MGYVRTEVISGGLDGLTDKSRLTLESIKTRCDLFNLIDSEKLFTQGFIQTDY